MSWELSKIKVSIQKLERAKELKGTNDCFDDSMVGPVTDDCGNAITDPVKLVAMSYSTV
jgi:hypothetical protein